MSDSNKTLETATIAVAKEVYGDLVRPSAAPLGEAFSGIVKAITHYPRYWARISEISLEEKVKRFEKNLKHKYEQIPEENRILPPPNVLGPSVQALEYGVLEDEISDLFASLISSSMNSQKNVHPSFVEIIRQLTPDEAKILKFFSKNPHQPVINIKEMIDGDGWIPSIENLSFIPEDSGCYDIRNGQYYLENLCRLGLGEIPRGLRITSDKEYDRLTTWFNGLEESQDKKADGNPRFEIERRFFRLTQFGRKFVEACVDE